MKIFFDSATTIKATIDKDTGFLTAPVTLARTGVQYYFGAELGLMDRASEKIGVYRPPEEVFKPESVAAYTNLVVTDDHPKEFVNTDNVKALQTGTVSHVEKSEHTLTGVVTITDKEKINKIKGGKVEVSVGYSNKLKEQKGKDGADEYEFIQTDIKPNHLAIVDNGRCGSDCKLTMDKKGDNKMQKITIDGLQYEVEDNVAGAYNKFLTDVEEEKKEEKKKTDEEMENLKKEKDEEIAEEKKEKEEAKGTADALKKSKTSDADIEVMVKDRAELLMTARTILGDAMPETCDDCPKELKVAVIDKVLGNDSDLSDKSMDYINAMYDMAIIKSKDTKQKLNNFGKELLDKDGEQVTRDTGRTSYVSKTQDAWKPKE